MIGKLRKAMDSVGDIDEMKKKAVNTMEEVKVIKKELGKIGSKVDEFLSKFDEDNGKAVAERDEAIVRINKVADEFQKEMNEFKTLRTRLQTDVVNKVCSEVKKELNVYLMNVREKIDSLNDAGKEIKRVADNSGKLLDSIDKLRKISSEIKKEDFELSKHAAELRRNDKEKLELLRKIDSLERLISKMRRRN